MIATINEIKTDGHASLSALRKQIESSLSIDEGLWTSWQSSTAIDKTLEEGLEFCNREKHQQGSWLKESLVPDHHMFKITRKRYQTYLDRYRGTLGDITQLEELGIRKRDRAYLKAKEESRTVSIPFS